MEKPKILVAPLNWGLGHATRCIPIINALILEKFEPIIASDGVALELLKKEFPDLVFLELPSYQIEYAKKAFFIPTPGQYEQEYLAKKLKKEGLVPYMKQDKFDFDKMLAEIGAYHGFEGFQAKQNWHKLFKIFR